ncbi:MAG: deoxyribonuclease IV [Solobacterium sp.]|nr:deoxyribonuclease IV [Solobacterium sp.]
MIIGCHVKMTAPEFLAGSVKEALSYDANALMLYTGAPQNTKRRPLEEMRIAEAKELMEKNGIPMQLMIIHAPYLINPANAVKPEVFELAGEFLYSEVIRTHAIGASYIVLHPGSYTTTDTKTGMDTVVRCLNGLPELPEGIVICLETMAGKGSELGRTFEELAEILERLDHPEHYGVCLDTCHINDAGYDVNDFDGVLDEFDRVLSLERLHVIHLNDSKNLRGARKDRHANIGLGTIGFETLHRIAMAPRTAHIPKILETPYIGGEPPYAREIAMLRKGVYEEGWQEHLTVSE